MGEKLTVARSALVQRFYRGVPIDIVDVGIGGGRFVREMHCSGTDINPAAIAWLRARSRLWHPALGSPAVLTFWDSIEHILRPWELINRLADNGMGKWVFVSTPVYANDPEIAKLSRHYKPGEHVWYFTALGLVRLMDEIGYGCVHTSMVESDLGRDSIMSFVFRA